jgi:hypothetical protein
LISGRQGASGSAQLLSNIATVHTISQFEFRSQNAAANVALNRKVQGGDSRNISGFPTHGIAQQC